MTLSALPNRLATAPPLIGTLVTMENPEAAEALVISGMHWLFVDAEHSPTLDTRSIQRITQAVAGRAYVIARIPVADEGWIARILDSGADGVIVPHVRSADDARRWVRAAKYPPLGTRGVGIARAHGYGMDLAGYLSRANDATALILQIEDAEAVRHIDDIVAVRGYDAVFIGPYDLSGSMGRLGKVDDPAVRAAVAQVRAACGAANVPFGIFSGTADAAADELAHGASFVAIGSDIGLMAGTARATLDSLHRKRHPDDHN